MKRFISLCGGIVLLLTSSLAAQSSAGVWRLAGPTHRPNTSSGADPLRIEYILAGSAITRQLSESGTHLRTENYTWSLPPVLVPGEVFTAWISAHSTGRNFGFNGRINMECGGQWFAAESQGDQRRDNTVLRGPAAPTKGSTITITVWVGIGSANIDYAVDHVYKWSPGESAGPPTPPPVSNKILRNYYTAGAFDGQGNRMAGAQVPWVISADGKIFAPGAWEGRFTRAEDGILHAKITVNSSSDEFDIKLTNEGFIAYKGGKPYRWGTFLRTE